MSSQTDRLLPGAYVASELIKKGLLFVGDGYRAKNRELSATGIPFARVGNVKFGFDFENADRFPIDDLARVGQKVSRPGDVVLTSKGTVGRFAFVTEETETFVYSPQLCFWRSLNHSVLMPRYLWYWFHSFEFQSQVDAVKSQTDMADYVSLRNQRRFKITVPSTEKQREVSDALIPLDALIENCQRRISLLREARSFLVPQLLDEILPE